LEDGGGGDGGRGRTRPQCLPCFHLCLCSCRGCMTSPSPPPAAGRDRRVAARHGRVLPAHHRAAEGRRELARAQGGGGGAARTGRAHGAGALRVPPPAPLLLRLQGPRVRGACARVCVFFVIVLCICVCVYRCGCVCVCTCVLLLLPKNPPKQHMAFLTRLVPLPPYPTHAIAAPPPQVRLAATASLRQLAKVAGGAWTQVHIRPSPPPLSPSLPCLAESVALHAPQLVDPDLCVCVCSYMCVCSRVRVCRRRSCPG
jgi:hypothetical protein